MDIQTASERHEMLENLIAVVSHLTPSFSERLKSKLDENEVKLYGAVEGVTFEEGNWFRPHHNFIATSAMLALCLKDDLERNVLMPAAILHYIGYSALKISKYGADWQGKDKRVAHMEAGALMAKDVLKDSSLSPEKIGEIIEIIRTHDNCYIGEPYQTHNQLYHRDADRLYVMSFSSFYKDALNYLDTGIIFSVEEHLIDRIAHFYESEDDNPIKPEFSLDRARSGKSEGKACIPFTLSTAKIFGGEQFVQRAEEVKERIADMNPSSFSKYSEQRLNLEADWLISRLF